MPEHRRPCHFHVDHLARPSGQFSDRRPRPRPEALIITCSDDTLDTGPIRRWQREPLLLVRTFGNEVPEYLHADDDWLAVLDSALGDWCVPDVIVCGHSDCRAVQAERASRRPHQSTHRLVDGGGSRMGVFRRRMAEAAAVTEQAKANVLRQLDHLRTYPLIEDRLAEDALHLTGLIYLHESGTLLRYEPAAGEFWAISVS